MSKQSPIDPADLPVVLISPGFEHLLDDVAPDTDPAPGTAVQSFLLLPGGDIPINLYLVSIKPGYTPDRIELGCTVTDPTAMNLFRSTIAQAVMTSQVAVVPGTSLTLWGVPSVFEHLVVQAVDDLGDSVRLDISLHRDGYLVADKREVL